MLDRQRKDSDEDEVEVVTVDDIKALKKAVHDVVIFNI